LRESLRAELKHLQKTEGVTTLYVTHDQIEALTMADRIGVLNRGKLVQVGTPEDIYDRPANAYVAKLVGSPRINLLPAEFDKGRLEIADVGISLELPGQKQLPKHVTVGIRPEAVQLAPSGKFIGKVSVSEPLGAESVIHISMGSGEIVCMVAGLVQLGHGDEACFDIRPDHLHFFDDQGNRI
jgi:multiple sugar transport system ATP-binding protein